MSSVENEKIDREFQTFIRDWEEKNCTEEYRKVRQENRDIIVAKYGCDDIPVDYNENVIRLNQGFIDREIKRIKGLDFDEEYVERYCNWIPKLLDREFVFQFIGSRHGIWIPELSMYFAVDDRDYNYVSKWYRRSEYEMFGLMNDKLCEVMGPEAAGEFINSISRVKVV